MTLRLLPYRPERDAYRLLGLPPQASADEIAAACRRLSRTFHPDRNRSGRATEEMQVVNAVRRVMTDPASRAEYDVARWRWHAAVARPREPMLHAWPPIESARRSPNVPERYARATWAGLRATLMALAPRRCRICRVVIGAEDSYCAACGTRLLTG
ncbi:MAG: J domain-containing protein [Candidatus Limnocylindria bacterium]